MSWIDLDTLCEENGWDSDDLMAIIQQHFSEGEEYLRESDGQFFIDSLIADTVCELAQDEMCEAAAEEEVYSGEQVAEMLELPNVDVLRARASKAVQNGYPLPGIKRVFSGQRGRPPYGYTDEFVQAMRVFLRAEPLDALSALGSSPAIGAARQMTITVKPDPMLDQMASRALAAVRASKGTIEFIELADLLNVPPKICRKAIEDLQTRGYDLHMACGNVSLNKAPSVVNTSTAPEWGGDRCRIGIVSDLHLGCYQSKLHSLQAAYRTFEEEECQFVLNLGDMFHGPSAMHKGYEYELALHSMEDQIEFAVRNYPNNMTTYFIDGNHDTAWHKQSGIFPVKQFCLHKPDNWHWCGALQGTLLGPNGEANFISMHHPIDASMHDLSLKGRRLAEFHTYDTGTVPSIIMYGHYHKFNLQHGPQDSYILQAPASCDLTPWMQARAIPNIMGALILDFVSDEAGVIRDLSVRHLSYRKGNEIDYSKYTHNPNRVVVTPEWKETIHA